MRFSIKHWPVHDRPRERVRALGPRALATRELLAILLETGVPPRDESPGRSAVELADDLLTAFAADNGEDSLRRLMSAPACTMAARVAGIGPAKAARVLAALELGRRAAEEAIPERPRICGARDVYEHMRLRLRDLDQEEFHLLLLNTQCELFRDVLVTRGTLDSSVVHARDVFRCAVAEAAASVVLVHNHPSGEPTPSREDRELTASLVRAGDCLGIPVADHVIIGEGRYWSFTDHHALGALPTPRRRLALAAA